MTPRRFALPAALMLMAGAASPALAQADAKAPEAAPAAKAPEAKPAADLPSAQAILDKYIEATGGRAAYEKVKNRRVNGTVEIAAMNLKGTVLMEQAAPNKMKFTMDLPGMGKTEQGTDGTDVWTSNAMMGAAVAEGDDREQALRASTFNRELRLMELYPTISVVAKEPVNGKDAFKVEMTPAKGPKETWYFDAESGLPLKSAVTVKSPMGEVVTETAFKEWTEVDGLKQPKATVMSQMGMDIAVTYDKIEQNIEFPENHFAAPKEVQDLKKGDKAPAGGAPAAPGDAPAPATDPAAVQPGKTDPAPR